MHSKLVHPIKKMTIWRGSIELKKDEIKQKRLQQMLEELRSGDVYMKMKWTSRP